MARTSLPTRLSTPALGAIGAACLALGVGLISGPTSVSVAAPTVKIQKTLSSPSLVPGEFGVVQARVPARNYCRLVLRNRRAPTSASVARRARSTTVTFSFRVATLAAVGKWIATVQCAGKPRKVGTVRKRNASLSLVTHQPRNARGLVVRGPIRMGSIAHRSTPDLSPHDRGAEAYPPHGQLMVAGSEWLDGEGVDVRSNGGVGHDSFRDGRFGLLYQCVELIQRLIITRGWSPPIPGNAAELYDNASSTYFDKHPNGSGYRPAAGDIVVLGGGVALPGCPSGGCGHVAVVEGVEGQYVRVVEQNSSPTGRGVMLIDDAGTIASRSESGRVIGVLHAKLNPRSGTPTTANPPVVAPPTAPVDPPATVTPPTTVVPPTTTTPPVTQPAPAAPRTYAAQQGSRGVNTFTNPYNASGLGPKVAPAQWVQVTCKVHAPQIASANPDGYWYRIASAPWNNAYYSPANTFMNGDPWGGPYSRNTDWSIPNC